MYNLALVSSESLCRYLYFMYVMFNWIFMEGKVNE